MPFQSRLSSLRTQADVTQRRIRGKNLSSSLPSPTPKQRLRHAVICHTKYVTIFLALVSNTFFQDNYTHTEMGCRVPAPSPITPRTCWDPHGHQYYFCVQVQGAGSEPPWTRDNHTGERESLGQWPGEGQCHWPRYEIREPPRLTHLGHIVPQCTRLLQILNWERPRVQ